MSRNPRDASPSKPDGFIDCTWSRRGIFLAASLAGSSALSRPFICRPTAVTRTRVICFFSTRPFYDVFHSAVDFDAIGCTIKPRRGWFFRNKTIIFSVRMFVYFVVFFFSYGQTIDFLPRFSISIEKWTFFFFFANYRASNITS